VKFLSRVLDVISFLFIANYQEKILKFAKLKEKMEKKYFKITLNYLKNYK
jgi:hypothetical protein